MANPDLLKRLALGKRKYYVYNVKFVCGIQKNKFETDCEAILSRGIYSTEINILNYGIKDVTIVKLFIPVVLQNKAIAREPKIQSFVNFERVELKRLSATMDDCCKILEMLKEQQADEQLKIGFIEIISPLPLEVFAVYTVTDLEQMHPSINVVQVEGKILSLG
jgi:hypothetical protein